MNWNEAEWDIQNLNVENMEFDKICKTQAKQHLLIHGQRTPQAHKLLCSSLNGTISSVADSESIKQLNNTIKLQPRRFLTPWSDNDQEGIFVNVDTGLPLENSVANWNPGEPNGGTLENCVVVLLSSGKMYDFPCDAQSHGLCYIVPRPRVKVRGEEVQELDFKNISFLTAKSSRKSARSR